MTTESVMCVIVAQMAEWFKATDLRPVIYDAWVRTPLCANNISSIAANPSEPIRISGSLLPQTPRAMMCFGKMCNLEFIEEG